jgi:hypothetical protein
LVLQVVVHRETFSTDYSDQRRKIPENFHKDIAVGIEEKDQPMMKRKEEVEVQSL